MKKHLFLFLTIHTAVYTFQVKAQPTVKPPQSWMIQSGPMVGYSDYREVLLWVQTKTSATVKFTFWEQGQPNQRRNTAEVRTQAAKANTAQALASDLTPGKRYEYEVVINGKKVARPYPLQFQTQTLWQWRTDPPAVRFAVGSCTYINESAYDRPGKPYGSNYQIFSMIASQKPDFMLWTGDNTYTREVDWNSRSGLLHRYTHTRALPEMQALLGGTHHYATWDDHDYGPDNADRSYSLKRDALDVFKAFWGNPNYVFENEGVTGTFQWADCQFFLMDDRWWRSPNELRQGPREFLGKKQLDWLLDALSNSQASFKFVVIGNQVVNPTAMPETYATYAEERAELFRRITEANVPGVLFLSGDRHHSILWKQERPGTYPLYDLTISPLTSGTAKLYPAEEPQVQFPETYVPEHNFGLLEVTGPLKDRMLKITCIDASGNAKWSREIRSTDLRTGK